jgi:hypothetical protein
LAGGRSMLKTVIAVIIAALVIPLAVVLIRFNRKRLYIIRCVEAADAQQLEAIYTHLDQLGTQTPSCAVLARTNRRSGSDRDWCVPVPPFVEPWAGRAIRADVASEVAFRLAGSAAPEPVLRGQVYRVVPVPRHLTKSGKARNQFSPSKYLAGNPQLLSALSAVCPEYPAELLAYLLAAGAETFEFDPMFQARIGGSPSWVQDAEFPECSECRKRMSLILQLPGALLPGKPMAEGTFFFFGCVNHPDKTKTVAQFA